MRPFALDFAQGLFSAFSLGLALSLGLISPAMAQSTVAQEFGKELNIMTPAEQVRYDAKHAGHSNKSGSVSTTAWETFFEQGQAYLDARSYEKAETSFRQALRSIKRVPHSDDQLVACMRALADVLQLQDYKELSWDLYLKSLKILEKAHGENSIILLPQLLTMGAVTELEGEYLKSISFYQRAADIARVKLGESSYQLAICQRHLGHAYFCSGNAGEAEKFYRQALYLMMAQASLPSRDLLMELLSDYSDLLVKYSGPTKNLASAYEKELLRDDVQSSDLLSLRAVPQSAFQQAILKREAEEMGGAQSTAPDTAPVESFSTVAQLLNAIPVGTASGGKAGSNTTSPSQLSSTGSEGVEYYERMIAIDVRTLGPDHPSVARDLRGLAALYISEKRYAEAIPLLERAISIYSSVYPAGDLSVQRLRLLLSLISDNADAAADLDASIAADTPALRGLGASASGQQADAGTASGASPVTVAASSAASGAANSVSTNAISTTVRIPLEAQTFEVAQRLNEIAFRSFCQGKMADARVNYSWALASISNATGVRSVFTAACLQDYARVMRVSGFAKQADQMQRQSKTILAEVLSKQLLRAYK